ncbi:MULTISPECIES: sodium:alanine symporter family protein [unclassified Ruegeria]|uniref:alanine/glycine:cation symporter family protein n=1 Tax=unclassified Ruegeria TaxID=2625375 RepID=UPI001ADCB6B5|nr:MULTISPECIES: sodium:alanine symporter family protein [unclassified Ruegeria]MBO9410977.1 alanine:cation symporter family protein [Ruegeria sp. R8_1]MBO9415178.1 alanine:cation symporter family protein [Ruegeria sp. R8_2]
MDFFVDGLNGILWNYVLVYGLLGAGLFFTIRLGALQFLHFGEMLRVITAAPSTDKRGITPFQALTVSLASRVGTGNLAGVAVALTLGGPGAIFWMWMVALVGMATAYSESTLAQLYKVTTKNGDFRGGPAFYISRGLNAPWAGAVFSVCLILSFGLIFVAVQSNSIAEALNGAFGIEKFWVGIGIAAGAAIVIFGGIKAIARVAEILVPFMAGGYLLIAVFVMILNITEVPGLLWLIVSSALGLQEAAGGVAGGVMAAMLNGIKRGLFSNEAGMGSAPNIAAVATPSPHHPSSQGLVQAFGCFVDTILVCTATALLILLSGVIDGEITGMQLTQNALDVHLGPVGTYFIAIAIIFFAFTSILGNYSYAENAMVYLGLEGKAPITALRAACLAMVVWGALQTVATVFNFADAAMGLMAVINLTAILLLSGTVYRLTKDYFGQRRAGQEPTFVLEDFEGATEGVSHKIWNEDAQCT